MVLISSVFLYIISIIDFTTQDRLQIQIKILSNIEEIPYDYEEDIAFFKDSCTKQQLLTLVEHKKPMIRVFAYCAILERKDIDCFPILKKNLSDTTILTWWYFDDAANSTYISDFYINMSLNHLSQTQKKELKNLILTNHLFLQNAYWIFEEMKPEDQFYNSIKERSLINKDHCNQERVVVALSKFKKEEDIPIIKRVIQKSNCDFLSFKIIEQWPHEKFFEILVKFFKKNIENKKVNGINDIEDFCFAVASYKNLKSLEILRKIVTKETYKTPEYFNYNREYAYSAMRFYNCPIYKELIEDLNKKIDSDLVIKKDEEFERIELQDWKYVY